MQKLIQRIGTQPRKFKFLIHLDKFRSNSSNTQSYRVSLHRQGKQFNSNYFRIQPYVQTSLKEVIKVTATMYYDRRAQTYQHKRFELIVHRSSKNNQAEQSKFEIDFEQLAIQRQSRRVLQDKMSFIQLTIISDYEDKGDHTGQRDGIRTNYRSQKLNKLLLNQKKIINEDPLEEAKRSTVEVIRFDDEVQKEESIMSVPLNTLITKSNQKNSSFRDLHIKEEREGTKSVNKLKARMRNRSKSKEIRAGQNVKTGVQEMLYQIQNQIGEERMRKSTIYEDMNQQKDYIINKLKQENSDLQMIINRFTNELEFSHKQVKDLESRYDNIYKKLNKTILEHRDIKQQRDRLNNENAQLQSALQLQRTSKPTQKGKQDLPKVAVDSSRLQRQIMQLKNQVKSLQGQLQSTESERVIMQSKYHEMLKKYKISTSELSAQKMSRGEEQRKRQTEQRQYYKQLKQKQQYVMQLKRNMKELELRLLRPEDELTKKEHSLLRQRLDKLMANFAEESKENKQLQAFLRKEIEAKKKQNQVLIQKLSVIEKSQSDQMSIYVNREKSLTRALEQKNKKILQLTKEIEKLKVKVSENSKFIQSEKAQLVKKMSYLSDQLTKRKEVSQELAISENRSRQLASKLKMLGTEKQELQVQTNKLKREVELIENKLKNNHASLSFVQQLQGQLVKVNTKVAMMMTLIFQKDPRMAQSIIQELGRS